jgi:hypothetical protein
MALTAARCQLHMQQEKQAQPQQQGMPLLLLHSCACE